MQTLDDFSLGGKAPGFRAGLERLYAMERGPLAQAASDTFDALQRIDAMRTTPYQAENGAAYGTDGFSQGLRQLARLIKADIGLEAASIDLDGWDSHFTQQTLLPALARQLTNGVSSFRRDLGARMCSRTPRKELWLARRGEVLEKAGRAAEARAAYQAALVAIDELPEQRRRTKMMTDLRADLAEKAATTISK